MLTIDLVTFQSVDVAVLHMKIMFAILKIEKHENQHHTCTVGCSQTVIIYRVQFKWNGIFYSFNVKTGNWTEESHLVSEFDNRTEEPEFLFQVLTAIKFDIKLKKS